MADAISGDTEPAHHPRDRVLEHVAVNEPITGVVGDERDSDRLLTVHEQGVAERAPVPFPYGFDGSDVREGAFRAAIRCR